MSNTAQASVPPSDEDANLDVVDEREVSWIIGGSNWAISKWVFCVSDLKWLVDEGCS